MSIECHRQLQPRAALFLKTQQCRSVDNRIGAAAKCHVIAAEFALLTKLVTEPPDSWVKEEQSLHDRLDHVPQVVPPTDMSELMRQNYLQLICAQMCQSRDGQQNDRTEYSHRQWPGDSLAYEQVNAPANTHALRQAINACRKGGTVSIPGVYGGWLDKFPLGAAFAKGLTLKMGQTHMHRYMPRLLQHIERGDIDPSFIITHRVGLDDAPEMYQTFREKEDSCIKVVMTPTPAAA